MPEVSATIRLRPTRIGFLVRPNDLKSIRKIMQYNMCVWGGMYNPIIPVFKIPPKHWRTGMKRDSKDISQGYVRFFEPDVYVESEKGLLEEAGLGALRPKLRLFSSVITLAEFLKPERAKSWSEPAFSLSMTDVFGHLYETEQRFELRDKAETYLVKSDPSNGLAEVVFGVFPNHRHADYFKRNYKGVFKAVEKEASVETWIEVFKKRAQVPLYLTNYDLDKKRSWSHDPVLFVFDPKQPTDLIDLWNMRLEPKPVLPVPIEWFEPLISEISKIIKSEFRKLEGNEHGVMHHATIEFSRSIKQETANALIKKLPKFPSGALVVKGWRNRIWVEHKDDFIFRDSRLEVTAEETRTTLVLNEEGNSYYANFEALSPKFATKYGGREHRWVNAVRISTYGSEVVGSVLPFNTFHRAWPRLETLGGEGTLIGTEGWIYPQRFKNSAQSIRFLSKEEAIIGSLKQMGIEATLSEPGHIAKQMLEHLGRLWSVKALADLKTIELLNKMAGGLRRKSNATDTVEESFERHSVPVKDWVDLIERRKKQDFGRFELEDFTSRNIIRLGLETTCPTCKATNWHSLTVADYKISCERCLNEYGFPQAKLQPNNKNWAYRVVGPFSVPDYGQGAYSSLLTLRALTCLHGSSDEMTFSTSLNVSFDSVKAEVDFVAFHRKDRMNDESVPELLIGETKSLGKKDLLKPKDIKKLKAVATKLPGAFIVVSVMRDHFTKNEKKLLTSLVKWGRKMDSNGMPTNPVILMTGKELFVEHFISDTWKNLGEPHSKFEDYNHTRNLHAFADSTQQIYLGLPPTSQVYMKKFEARRAKALAKRQAAGAS